MANVQNDFDLFETTWSYFNTLIFVTFKCYVVKSKTPL